jgi:hypothetical protein
LQTIAQATRLIDPSFPQDRYNTDPSPSSPSYLSPYLSQSINQSVSQSVNQISPILSLQREEGDEKEEREEKKLTVGNFFSSFSTPSLT